MSNLVDRYSSLRTCVEKTSVANAKTASKGLRAAFLKKNIWPANTKTLKIQLLEPATRVKWTPLDEMKMLKDTNGNPIIPDPLEAKARSLQGDIKAVIELVLRERLQPIIGINFEFTNAVGDIRVGFDPAEGAYSLVGTDSIHPNAPQKTMNLGWLDVSTIIHEFCHALGMIHEHQNPNGKTIPWNEKEVYKWAQATQGWDKETTYTNIVKKYELNQINGSDFDSKSIMLYFFPGALTIDGVGTNMNCWLSPTDVLWLSQIYPGGKMTPDEYYKYAYKTSITFQNSILTVFTSNLGYSIPLVVLVCIVIGLVIYLITKNTVTIPESTMQQLVKLPSEQPQQQSLPQIPLPQQSLPLQLPQQSLPLQLPQQSLPPLPSEQPLQTALSPQQQRPILPRQEEQFPRSPEFTTTPADIQGNNTSRKLTKQALGQQHISVKTALVQPEVANFKPDEKAEFTSADLQESFSQKSRSTDFNYKFDTFDALPNEMPSYPYNREVFVQNHPRDQK